MAHTDWKGRYKSLRAAVGKHGGRAARGVRRHHGKVTGGIKGTGIAGAVGAAAYFATEFATEKMDTLKNQPYYTSLGLLVGGHFLKRKHHDAGTALAGIAGYHAASVYRMKNPKQASGFTDGGNAGAVEDAFSPMMPGGQASGPMDSTARTSSGAPQEIGWLPYQPAQYSAAPSLMPSGVYADWGQGSTVSGLDGGEAGMAIGGEASGASDAYDLYGG